MTSPGLLELKLCVSWISITQWHCLDSTTGAYYDIFFYPSTDNSKSQVKTPIQNYFENVLTGQKKFPTKIFPYIFHIKPFIFKTFSWSHSLSDFHEIFSIKCRNKYSLFEFILISSCNFFELLFTSIYYLNTNVNSWRHNFIWLYSCDDGDIVTLLSVRPFVRPSVTVPWTL
jgi:hypothetical protein